MTRYASVSSTTTIVPRFRRRFGLLVASKCRLPACGRNTLPVAVILNRFDTAFRVLLPFGRRIFSHFLQKERAI